MNILVILHCVLSIDGKKHFPGSEVEVSESLYKNLTNRAKPLCIKKSETEKVVELKKAKIETGKPESKEAGVSINDLTVAELKEEIDSRNGEYKSDDLKAKLVEILTDLIKQEN